LATFPDMLVSITTLRSPLLASTVAVSESMAAKRTGGHTGSSFISHMRNDVRGLMFRPLTYGSLSSFVVSGVVNLTYSLQCRVASEPVRWRDEGRSQRGVSFAAGCGLWGRRWRLSGADYGGNRRPVIYGPVGINAPARWRIKVASGQAAAKARRTRDEGQG